MTKGGKDHQLELEGNLTKWVVNFVFKWKNIKYSLHF